MRSISSWLASAALVLAACRAPGPAAPEPAAPPPAEVVAIAPGALPWATADSGWVALDSGRAAVLRFRPTAVRARLFTGGGPVAATVRARVLPGRGSVKLTVAGAPVQPGDPGAPVSAAARLAAEAVGARPGDLAVRVELVAPAPVAATAQLAVATIAALLGDAPADDAAVIAGLASDGTLAPAATAAELARAAAAAGVTRIGVAAAQFGADAAATLERDTGATVVVLDDLDAAYELCTGVALPSPAAAAVPVMPAQVRERAAAALGTWRGELAQRWAEVITTAEGAGVSARAQRAGSAALASARLAETARQRGATLAALWLTGRARAEAELALASAAQPPDAPAAAEPVPAEPAPDAGEPEPEPGAPEPEAPAATAPARASTALLASPGEAAAPAAATPGPASLAAAAWWSAVAPAATPEPAAAEARAVARAIDAAAAPAPALSQQRQLALARHRALATSSAARTATGASPSAAAIWLALGDELAAYDRAAALGAFRRASLEARLAISSARRTAAPSPAPSAGSRPEGRPSPSAPPASR